MAQPNDDDDRQLQEFLDANPEFNRAIERRIARAAEDKIKAAEDKTKAAEDKTKAAEDKIKAAEDKIKAAEDKIKAAEDKAATAEVKAKTLKYVWLLHNRCAVQARRASGLRF